MCTCIDFDVSEFSFRGGAKFVRTVTAASVLFGLEFRCCAHVSIIFAAAAAAIAAASAAAIITPDIISFHLNSVLLCVSELARLLQITFKQF